MRPIIKYLIIILILTQTVFAQAQQSAHQSDKLKHGFRTRQDSPFDNSGKGIIKYNTKKFRAPAKTVFGYLPDWEYQNAAQYLQYDLLTHIAAFDFPVTPQGDISLPSYWPWTDVINDAHVNGVKMIMTTTNFETTEIHTLLTNTDSKDNFFNQVKSIIQTYNLQGVNVDFENLAVDDRGALLNGFMAELTDFLHFELPGTEVSFAGPAVNWGGWELGGLAASCDYIFIMGYSFYGSWSATSGPCAPLNGGSKNITNTVEVQYADVTNNNPEKLILGVPYYGLRWETTTANPYSETISFLNSPRYRTAFPEAQTHGELWDNSSQTPWYNYMESSKIYQSWFDTDSSLGLKYDLSDIHNLKGVGMWALGYDGSYSELWDELRERYGSASSIQNHTGQITPFHLQQNSPNPFNASTTINYELGISAYIELTIYNILGQRVETLVSGNQKIGRYIVRWNALNFPSGLYFVELKTEHFRKTASMLLVK